MGEVGEIATEEWRTVPVALGYEISSLGRVRRKEITVAVRRQSCAYTRQYPQRDKRIVTNKRGYAEVSLCQNGTQKTWRIHRLVALAFIPNPLNFDQINHKNCNQLDNRVENLEWCNSSWNQKHAIANGLNPPKQGILHGNSKLTNTQVYDIRRMRDSGAELTEIMSKYGICAASASTIGQRKSWKHLPEEN